MTISFSKNVYKNIQNIQETSWDDLWRRQSFPFPPADRPC